MSRLHKWVPRTFDSEGEWQVDGKTITTCMHTVQCEHCGVKVSLPDSQLPDADGCPGTMPAQQKSKSNGVGAGRAAYI